MASRSIESAILPPWLFMLVLSRDLLRNQRAHSMSQPQPAASGRMVLATTRGSNTLACSENGHLVIKVN